MNKYLFDTLRFINKKIYKPYMPNILKWRITSLFSGKCHKGKGSYIHPSAHMTGVKYINIGINTCIGEDTWLNVNNRMKGKYSIKIGDNCFIGRRNFFTSGKNITIGDYALTAIDCKFICANHVSENPLLPYIASGVSYSDSIYVGTNCFFGAGVTVIGNISIGHGSVLGANALITKDIPPFSIVIGNPARVLRRYSFSKQKWIDANQIQDKDLLDNPDEETYLKILKETHPKIAMPLPAAGSNFGNI